MPESVLGPSRKALVVSSTKRKRGCDSHGADGVVAAAEEDVAGGLGLTATSSKGNAPGQGSGERSSPAGSEMLNGGNPGGANEQRDATQQQGPEGGRLPQTDTPSGAWGRERCECPCFCGRRDAFSPFSGRTGVDSSSHSIARVGAASADLSRVEQLVGGAAMVRGCALGVGFVARATGLSPGLSVSGALDLLDAATAARDKGGGGEGEEGGGGGGGGLMSLVFGGGKRPLDGCEEQGNAATMASFCGGPLVALPRRFEVAAALHRLPGVQFGPAAAAAVDYAKETTSSAEPAEKVA